MEHWRVNVALLSCIPIILIVYFLLKKLLMKVCREVIVIAKLHIRSKLYSFPKNMKWKSAQIIYPAAGFLPPLFVSLPHTLTTLHLHTFSTVGSGPWGRSLHIDWVVGTVHVWLTIWYKNKSDMFEKPNQIIHIIYTIYLKSVMLLDIAQVRHLSFCYLSARPSYGLFSDAYFFNRKCGS